MDTKFLDLYNEFLIYADKGDEAGARKFLADNLQKFPEDLQEKLIFAFFQEALENEVKGAQDKLEIQKQGLEALSQIEKAKKMIQDQIKVKDLKSKLAQ